MHHQFFHGLELVVIIFVTISSWSFMFANLTGLNQDLYRNNDTEVAQGLLNAMQNPATSLKQGNIISIRNMDLDVENTFAKWYCTYGAARISPEFFPYINEATQQRTWWGNAIDRCKNAAETWYKIWLTPSQWALIIYEAGGRFWSYGHVGKVMHYDRSLKKLIVRDMARVGKGQMSDRREDLTTANVKCYIYNSKKDIPVDVPEVYTWTTLSPVVITTWATSITPPITVVTPTKPVVTQPEQPTDPVVITPIIPTPEPTPSTIPIVVEIPEQHTAPTVITPTVITPVVISPAIVSPVVVQDPLHKGLDLKFEDLRDIAQHFMTQNDLTITLVWKSLLKVGESATVTIEIKNKNTGEKYAGLLPFAFNIISTNDILQPSMSNIKFINDGSMDITILGQKVWTATIVIIIDDTKIGEFSLEVK